MKEIKAEQTFLSKINYVLSLTFNIIYIFDITTIIIVYHVLVFVLHSSSLHSALVRLFNATELLPYAWEQLSLSQASEERPLPL